MQPKEWKTGVADEAWKVLISSRDYHDTEHLLQTMVLILTDSGPNVEQGLKDISEMTGEQIVKALLSYRDKAFDAIKNGLKL